MLGFDALPDGALGLVLSTVDVVSDVVTASSPPLADYFARLGASRRDTANDPRESVTDTSTPLEHNAI